MNKIYELQNALMNLGIQTTLYESIEWSYCLDGKTHYGIELETNITDADGENFCFIFKPNGEFVQSCLECPIKITKGKKKRGNKK